jgi:glycosyltransferase involved in cell wall biosynthesis
MQNVAVSYGKFATSKSGGARESLLTLLNGVTEHLNLSVDVYQTPPVDDEPETPFPYQIHTCPLREVPKLTWTNQVVGRIQWKKFLRRRLQSDHDLLITQNRLAPASVAVANERGIPSLCFIRSMALTGYEKYSPTCGHIVNLWQTDLGGRIQYPFLVKNFREYERAATTASQTIANSEFTASKIRDLFGVDPEIIYPPIEPESYRVTYDADGYITMVNPRTVYKGPDIFLDIAAKMPDEDFLLVGPIGSTDIKHRAKRSLNVTHWEWCEDMRDAYAETKLVVVPSRVEETFGRVPAEAMVSGIPCVVSNRGGLPEVVGDTGEVVTDIESTDTWIDAIHRGLSSHHPAAQKQRAEMFSTQRQISKLLEIIEEVQQR